MEWTPTWLRMTGFYCIKPPGNRTAAKKTETPGSRRDARPCVPGSTTVRPPPRGMVNTTGSPWWSLAQRFRRFPNAAFWCFALVRGFLPWIIRLEPIGLVLQPFLIHLASTSFFSPITWLDICKSEIKNPEQVKTSVIGEIGA